MIRKAIVLFVFAAILFIMSYYVSIWTGDFVDPCCSGLCGRCPPSFWECFFMGSVSMFQMFIGIGSCAMGLKELIEKPCKEE